MKNWIILAIAALVLYFAWRKFGGGVKDAITSVTS